ncbi:Tyrosine-protein phosphatase non-receptor type 13 [Glugoides intestinalis]
MKNAKVFEMLTMEKEELVKLVIERKYKKILEIFNDICRRFILQKSEYDKYQNVLPYDKSVSKGLEIPYINASFVTIEEDNYIACQNPKSCYSAFFLEFLKKANAQCVICLRSDIKYTRNYTLINSKTIQFEGDDFIKDEIFSIDGIDIRIVCCLSWNDYGILTVAQMEFLSDYLSMFDSKMKIIHCEAGVGRTGTLIMFRALKKLQKVKVEHFIDTLIEMRSQRHLLVQNVSQLSFLADYFLHK